MSTRKPRAERPEAGRRSEEERRQAARMPTADAVLRLMNEADVRRFWDRVDVGLPQACWLWPGAKDRCGYGSFSIQNRSHSTHRIAFVLTNGHISQEQVLDHLCRNRACINPAHLEPVTARENVLRSPNSVAAINASKTHCKHGHEFTPENTISELNDNGFPRRRCRTCRRIRDERRRKAVA